MYLRYIVRGSVRKSVVRIIIGVARSLVMTESIVEMHKKVRSARSSAFAELMDRVYSAMTASDRKSLPDRYPDDIGEYVNAIVAHALGHLTDFGNDLKKTVIGTFKENTSGERFILDSTRTDSLNTFCLFVDMDVALVTVRDPELERLSKGRGDPGTLIMKSFQSYEVLTGPHAGETFARHQSSLPAEFVVKPFRSVRQEASTAIDETLPPSKRLSIFLCHASDEKVAVRDLRRSLISWGHEPWLDEEKILPGQDWEREIRYAMKKAYIIIVCLSSRSEKRGNIQKEMRCALDIADEQPDGTIFIIPVKFEPCSAPERLTKWQWVDLFSKGGEAKLQAALQAAAYALPDSEMPE